MTVLNKNCVQKLMIKLNCLNPYHLTTFSFLLGCLAPIAMTYVSEVSQKEYRGTFLASIFVSITFGLSLNYILNSLVTWRTMAIIMLLIATSGYIGTFFIPESNFWYLQQGDKEAAKKSIKWFESAMTTEELDERVENILTVSEVDAGNKGKYYLDFIRDLRYKKFYKPFLIALIVNFFRGGNGRLVLGVYVETLFKDMNTPYEISSLIRWFGWAEFISSFVILFFMHKMKRKTVVIAATIILVASLSTVVIYLSTKDTYNLIPPWLAVSTLYSYAMCVMTAYSSVITIIISEMQPPTYRPQINVFQNGVLFIIYSFNTFTFPYAEKVIHIQYILIYFILSIIACSLTVLALVPETSKMEFYENKEKSVSNNTISIKL